MLWSKVSPLISTTDAFKLVIIQSAYLKGGNHTEHDAQEPKEQADPG